MSCLPLESNVGGEADNLSFEEFSAAAKNAIACKKQLFVASTRGFLIEQRLRRIAKIVNTIISAGGSEVPVRYYDKVPGYDVRLVRLDPNPSEWHPDRATEAQIAAKLTEFVRELQPHVDRFFADTGLRVILPLDQSVKLANGDTRFCYLKVVVDARHWLEEANIVVWPLHAAASHESAAASIVLLHTSESLEKKRKLAEFAASSGAAATATTTQTSASTTPAIFNSSSAVIRLPADVITKARVARPQTSSSMKTSPSSAALSLSMFMPGGGEPEGKRASAVRARDFVQCAAATLNGFDDDDDDEDND
jgi:hypothetical protein